MKKNLFLIIIIFIVIFLLIFLLAYMERKQPMQKTHLIQIYGHRGACGLSPENSIPAYKTALAVGVDYVDMDVNMTRDGMVVVAHDFTLNPNLTRDKNGQWINSDNPPLIKNLTFAQLQQYDIGKLKPNTDYSKNFPYQYPVDGARISSLEQVIEYVKKITNNNVRYQVEIKTDPEHPDWSFTPKVIAAATVKVLKKEGVDDRTELQAFDWQVLQIVKQLDPKIAVAYLTDAESSKAMSDKNPMIAGAWTGGFLLRDYHYSIPGMIAKLGGKIWSVESKELTADLVKEAHQYGLKVVPWSQVDSLDDPKEIIRMIDIGVDGIISDRPDIVRGLLAARGLPVPKSYSSAILGK